MEQQKIGAPRASERWMDVRATTIDVRATTIDVRATTIDICATTIDICATAIDICAAWVRVGLHQRAKEAVYSGKGHW